MVFLAFDMMLPPRDGVETVVLESVLLSGQAGGLAERLQATTGRLVAVDGGAVERLGGLCLQVLLSADLSFQAAGRALRICRPSEGLREGMLLLGVSLRPAEEAGA